MDSRKPGKAKSFTQPVKAKESELSEEELKEVVGGTKGPVQLHGFNFVKKFDKATPLTGS